MSMLYGPCAVQTTTNTVIIQNKEKYPIPKPIVKTFESKLIKISLHIKSLKNIKMILSFSKISKKKN